MHIKVSLRPMNVSKDKKALYNQCYKKKQIHYCSRDVINSLTKLENFSISSFIFLKTMRWVSIEL